jgi:CheY-like chemotaxis protein
MPGDRIAIIAMTAETHCGARDQCLSAGMDEYVAKPVTLQDLSRAIEKWLPQGKARVENAPGAVRSCD